MSNKNYPVCGTEKDVPEMKIWLLKFFKLYPPKKSLDIEDMPAKEVIDLFYQYRTNIAYASADFADAKAIPYPSTNIREVKQGEIPEEINELIESLWKSSDFRTGGAPNTFRAGATEMYHKMQEEIGEYRKELEYIVGAFPPSAPAVMRIKGLLAKYPHS